MWIPFRLMPRKGGYMDADTPLPEKCVQERRVSTYVFHSFSRVKSIYRTFALNAYQAQYLFVKKRSTGKTEFISEP